MGGIRRLGAMESQSSGYNVKEKWIRLTLVRRGCGAGVNQKKEEQ